MSDWKWLNRKVLLLLHDESLAEHGGASGLRDEGLLDSGFRLMATQAEATLTILDVAAGEIDEATLAQWIRTQIQPR